MSVDTITTNTSDPRVTVNLFTDAGGLVDTIKVPDPHPGIVIYKGLYFHLKNGRYVQATVWTHVG